MRLAVRTPPSELFRYASRKRWTKQRKNDCSTRSAGNLAAVAAILDDDPDAMESIGEHNRNVRDKTPLMFAMQCFNLQLAHVLLDRGANANAEMPGGPGYSVLSLCMQFAYCDRRPRRVDSVGTD